MAELVDAPASGAGNREVVKVRVLSWAPEVDECIYSRVERLFLYIVASIQNIPR